MKKQFLDNSGMLELVSLLKKYIHDNKVRPFTNKSLFPKTGKEDLIYIDNSNDLLYRWDAGAGAYKPLSPLKVSELVNDSGFLSSVPTATNTVTGGVLADTKTSTDTVPVKIGSDKKLYTTPTLSDAGKAHIQNGDIHTTVADKQKATTAYNHSQTAHAPSNAERNIIVGVQKNGTDLSVDTSTRKVNIAVPTKVSELTNDSGFKTTDNNTTYTLTKSGNTITLTGSDGSKTAVVDENTTYTALKNPHAITISINGASQGVYDGSSAKAVDITNTKLGLGNVENKSSATIRSEITKANVTTALGYTPMTPNEINNKFATLETNIDWKESVATYADIATTYPNPVDGWTVNVNDTDYTYRYNGTSWIAISANAIPKATNTVDGILSKEDHTNFADANAKKHTHGNKSVIDGITSNNISTWNTVTNKVDKVSGKGLSTNDYTTAEKNKLSGIATGAEVNQNAYSNIKIGSTTISADTKTDTLEIIAGSNVTITPDAANDKVTIAAKDTIYTHPSATAYTSGLYKITTNNLGHVTAATAVTKADITALGIPGQDTNTTYGLASSTANGLIKIGYGANGRNYPVALDSTGKAYVTVPWTDTNTTYTLASFGITASAAEINQIKGATSGIQTQLNNKAPLSHTHGYLPLSGGSMTGSVMFTEDASGLKWNRVTDGASILFHSESDHSDNALTFNVSDNGDEYFKWTQTSSTATETLGTWKTEGIRLSKGNFIGNLIGNANTASSAATLATARTINGTAFNGSSNIVTANWGTARNITIGSTSKSVNGSNNVAWSLSEIGAAPASHSHNYLPLSGGTIPNLNSINTISDVSTNIVPSETSIASSPFARSLWHDRFAFLSDIAIKDSQVMNNGSSSWVNDTDINLKTLFIQKEMSRLELLNKGQLARRFTIFSEAVAYSGVSWIELGVCYSDTYSQCEILIELSTNGTVWTTGHKSVLGVNGGPCYLKVVGLSNNKYIRFTFTKKNNQTTGALSISCLKGLTIRKGDQGKGIEYELPYDWDINRNIYPYGTNTSCLGTSYKKWKNIYATVFTGNLSGNASTATKADKIKDAGDGRDIFINYSKANSTTFNYFGVWENNTLVSTDATQIKNKLGLNNVNNTADSVKNVNSAATLTTARTINGTSFNGSSNITTATWGTARNFTIGNSTKSVNGSGNMSWSLSEIGASASNHTHNYAGSTTVGGAANSAIKLATPRSINGVNFDGTANINILANPITNTLTGQDLNDVKNPGFYVGGGSNTVKNKPSDFDAFGLTVIKSASGYVTQFCVGGNNSPNKIFVRVFNSSTWGAWDYVYTSAYKPTKSDVGLSNVDNTADAVKNVKHASTATALTTNAGSATQPVYFSGGKPVVCTYTLGKSVPSNAVFTDTVYTHPSTSGNKHIPSGGSAGQILRWSADGTAVWGADNNTVYSAFKGANGSAAGTQGLVPGPAAADNVKYLRGDGVWATPPNTTYGVVTGSANGLMTPALFNKLNGIAAGANNYTHPANHNASMIVQDTTHRFITDAERSAWNSKANASHSHNYITTVGDNRNEATTPNTYSSKLLFSGLKYNNKIGNPSSDTYSYVLGLRGWSDNSGGSAHELAFNDHGLCLRKGADTTWGAWETVITSANYTTYSPSKTGSGASGTWGINITGNSATTNKLKTAVKIGNANFDGSASISLASMGIINPIEITKVEYDKLKAAGQLNMSAYYNIIDDFDAATIINDSAVAANQVFSSQKTEATYAKKSTVVDTTLSAANWVGAAAPYTYTLNISGVTATSINEINYKYSNNDTQITAYQNALLRDGGQSTGKIILKAAGTKPTVDIPITIIVRHDV